jgi:hypothetical protein
MMIKKFALLAAATMLTVGVNAPALAQGKPAAKATPPAAKAPEGGASLTKEQQEHGIRTFGLLASAMQSKNVPNEVKSVLMLCVYENSVGKISEAMDKVVAANPGKIDSAKPEEMLSLMAQICGYEPPATAKAAPDTAPATPPAGR